MFSQSLSDFSSEKNELYILLDKLTKSGVKVIDLISGNPTQFGINFPKDALSKLTSNYVKNFSAYKPDPKGLLLARKSIAKYYLAEDYSVGAENIVLTPGTSESYLYIFRLLANTGNEILCPRPSYPLFEFIAKIAGVTLSYYNLSEEHNWQVDFKSLEDGINSKTAAVIVISPHNPTGHICSEGEVNNIYKICKQHNLPIIVDEVFCEFNFTKKEYPRFINKDFPLVFTLNGVSKMFALPQLKLGWIAVSGKEKNVREAVSRLETFADTFLATSDLSQSILPELFVLGSEFLGRYTKEIRHRRNTIFQVWKGGSSYEIFPPDGGFYLVSRIPQTYTKSSFDFALEILRNKHVLIHPASFYDFKNDRYFVASFLQNKEILKKGFTKILSF